MKELLEKINEAYPLEEIPAKEYEHFKVGMMNMTAKGYEAKGLGHVSVMEGKMPLGIMTMTSFVVNPFDIDMPLLSVDMIKAMGNISIYLEQFDTLLNDKRKEDVFLNILKEYEDLQEGGKKANWYDDILYGCSTIKKGKKKDERRILELRDAYFDAYLDQCKDTHECDRIEKKKKADEYSNGLINNGGPSTDVFLKNFGKERTEEFFHKVMFG